MASGKVSLDPELSSRLQNVRDQEARNASLRRRVRLERWILLPLLAAALLAWPNFGTAKVIGRSMEPTYHTGDTLVLLKTYRWFSPLKPGDIVVVHMLHSKIKGEEIVKRVAFVQNARGDAPFPASIPTQHGPISTSRLFPELLSGMVRMPPGSILIIGDNLPYSMDSRELGPIVDGEIIGKVIAQR